MVCPRHTFDKDGHKLNLIERLEEAEVAAETAASNKAAAQRLAQALTLSSKLSAHHSGERVAESPRSASLEHTMDTEPQSQPDAEITNAHAYRPWA